MAKIHGLAVVLIIFEGIIIQCEGYPNPTSSNTIPDLPRQSLVDIIKEAESGPISEELDLKMSEELKNRIVKIGPVLLPGETLEFYLAGDIFLEFGSYYSLRSFLRNFGNKVRKIEIYHVSYGSRSMPANQTDLYNIEEYANNIDDLRIITVDERVWDVISNRKYDIIFPNVEKFVYHSKSSRIEFKLDIMFHKLKSFKLIGNIEVANSLVDVTALEELDLGHCITIQEDQLRSIFVKNGNIKNISILSPNEAETMRSIAEKLTQLQSLTVTKPGRNFLFRPSNEAILYKLPSVIHLNIYFDEKDELVGDLSFDMPLLNTLRLFAMRPDDRIFDFIKSFKELENIEFHVNGYRNLEWIKKITNTKKLTGFYIGDNELTTLKNVFEDFNEKSNLETLELHTFSSQNYDFAMEKINDELRKISKPTWTLSYGETIEPVKRCLMFERQPIYESEHNNKCKIM